MTDKKKDTVDQIAGMFDSRRKFTVEDDDGTVREYYIGVPTAEDIRAADWHHAKVYNRGLREGIFTAAEMMELLKERNIIGEKYDEVAEELRTKLGEKLLEMETETDRDKRVLLAMEVAQLREQVFQWNQRLSSPLSSTCEAISNDSRTEFLTSRLIEDKDGNKVWNSFDEYKTEKDIKLQSQARFEVMLWLEGVESDFLSNTPENQVLSAYLDADTLAESAPEDELLKAVEEGSSPEQAGMDDKKNKPKKKTPSKRGRKSKKSSSK